MSANPDFGSGLVLAPGIIKSPGAGVNPTMFPETSSYEDCTGELKGDLAIITLLESSPTELRYTSQICLDSSRLISIPPSEVFGMGEINITTTSDISA